MNAVYLAISLGNAGAPEDLICQARILCCDHWLPAEVHCLTHMLPRSRLIRMAELNSKDDAEIFVAPDKCSG